VRADIYCCLPTRPSFWQERLCPRWTDSQAARSSTPCCLAVATNLERICVSAAARTTWPGDSFEDAGDFPGLAWLPKALGKDNLLVRHLTLRDA